MMEIAHKQGPTSFKIKWESFVAVGCLVAIALHFLLKTDISLPAIQIAGHVLHFSAIKDIPLIVVIFAGGIPLLLQIALKILKGEFGTDLLGAISVITSVMLGEYLAGTLIILMLAGGQALESFAMRRASFALRALASRMPSSAHRKINNLTEDISINAIRIGDFLEVHPHETCPVDGTVTEGHGTMDEAYLTGEPYQISKAPGTSVLSGAINGEAMLTIRADELAQDSRYAKIMKVMEGAEQERPHLRRLGDQIGMIFTPLAISIALVAWYMTGNPLRFLSVMVMATPCPLLIAIPVTIISAISMAARRGIIIKDPVVLERLPTCRTAIFDKTGTLTYGAPELAKIMTANKFTDSDVLQMTASLERYSKHPLSGAILKMAKERDLKLLQAERVSEKPGQGLSGRVNGHEILVTHRKKLSLTSPEQTALLLPPEHGLECMIVIDGLLAASFSFHDSPRREGRSFIGHLAPRHGFKKIMLVSGDRSSEVDYLASLLGIKSAYASQTPEQKLALVREEATIAPTLFMGDGINDAPALAAATVGIAFGQGSSVTGEAAGAVILESSLSKVDELLHISLLLRRIALESALGGMLLSVIGMGFAAAGYITPVMGALLQEAIDVLAIINALRMTLLHSIATDITSEAAVTM